MASAPAVSPPFLCMADNMDDLRLRWRQTLVGGADPGPHAAASPLAPHLHSIHRPQQLDLAAKARRPARPSGPISPAPISPPTSAAPTDACAIWPSPGLRPGKRSIRTPGLLADILAGLDWMDAHRYNSRSNEYDNWWDWEIGTPAILVDTAILLYDQLTPDQLARYMAAVERFDSNPSIMIVNTSRPAPTWPTSAKSRCCAACW